MCALFKFRRRRGSRARTTPSLDPTRSRKRGRRCWRCAAADWIALATRTARAGITLIAFVPCVVEELPRALRRALAIVPWDRRTSVRDVERGRAKRSRPSALDDRFSADDLARLVSIAPR